MLARFRCGMQGFTYGGPAPALLMNVPRDPAHHDARYASALQKFDEENARDPNLVEIDGTSRPYELVYAEWLTDWVLKLCPEASEPLLLAARCQHICRWMIPRNTYEPTRAGYLRWREDLKRFHAAKTGEILRQTGYPEETISRVQELNLKKNLATDPECQTLEDALCLVTLQYQLSGLLEKNGPEKLAAILEKTWRKMSPAARNHALQLPLSASERALVETVIARA